jgi:hypothetical protein
MTVLMDAAIAAGTGASLGSGALAATSVGGHLAEGGEHCVHQMAPHILVQIPAAFPGMERIAGSQRRL